MDLRERYRGAIYGLAIGDALGMPTEFKSLRQIEQAFGPNGIQDLPPKGMFTDDTQMSVALAEGLLDGGVDPDPEVVMPHVARRFVAWSKSPENFRAPGRTCMTACWRLDSGTPWKGAGVVHSKGCGAAMRAAPIGLLYADRAELRAIAHASSLVTHGHPASLAATHAAALAVRLLVEGTPPDDLLPGLHETTGLAPDWDELLARVPTALSATRDGAATPREVQQKGVEPWRLGESWVAEEAVASALYCFLLAHERGAGYPCAVRAGANTQGDSDSIACIAGGFAGACWGVGAIPADWVQRVEDREPLGGLADRLLAARRG